MPIELDEFPRHSNKHKTAKFNDDEAYEKGDSRRVNTDITSEHAAYLAGIIDGEGSFQVSPKSNQFGIVVGVTDKSLIEWLYIHIGGKKFNGGLTSANNRVYRWNVQKHDDLDFLLGRIIPYLVIKRVQAIKMLELVQHIQSRPRWSIPTAQCPKHERPLRREQVRIWRKEREQLHLEVQKARHVAL